MQKDHSSVDWFSANVLILVQMRMGPNRAREIKFYSTASPLHSLSLSLSLWRAVGGLARVLLQTDLKCYPQICMPEILLSLPLVRQIPPQSLALEFTGVQISHFITPTFQVSKSQPILTNCYQWPHTPTSSKEYIS